MEGEGRYKALFAEHKKERNITLFRSTVERLVERNGGLYAVVSSEGREVRFWVRKKDRPYGSRCKVYCREGEALPVISREKSNFSVRPGTEVLHVRPHKGSAFPVISLSEYLEALSGCRQPETDAPQSARRKDHQWVPAPPLNKTPPQK